MTNQPILCPCGNANKEYTDCCAGYLKGCKDPTTAEALMRSRYTAYTLGNEDYLLSTWHPSTRPDSLKLADGPHKKWLGLRISRHEPRFSIRTESGRINGCEFCWQIE
ncbi:MAG: YchJ family metal-binding protein [Nitrosomonadaceae bacterium]|nr:YchJ family metal-binding protein [Nitrosomonadaceae bacterium]MDW7618376.1 YchJ family metal-binding protein [Nitrosomonadaceae bacterium]MDW7647434.1 YchJ family metal-binding protein [Nitrosomonadaceae bacterium]MDW7666511.1 YchJ family metal-binding protein [Nitrosomonadaceae bacterium]